MSDSTDKASADNPLNVRLSLSKSFTRKLGDDYQKIIVAVETDKPQGVDVPRALQQLSESLDGFLSRIVETGPDRPENTNLGPALGLSGPATAPEDPLVEATVIDGSTLDRLPWKTTAKGLQWIFSNTPEAHQVRALLSSSSDKTVVVAGHRYKLSGDGDKFINRWRAKD